MPRKLSYLVVCAVLLVGASVRAEITLVSPPDGMTMSHIAVSFKANSTAEGPYHLEVSRDKNFGGAEITRVVSPEKGRNTNNVYFFRENGFALSEGTWYWRVAEADKSRWSETRTVHIDCSLDMKEPQRVISPENPLFHARLRSSICTKPEAAERLAKIIPSELKKYLVLDHPTTWPGFFRGHTVIEYYQLVDALGYPFLMDVGRVDCVNHRNQGDRAVTLGEVEYVFQNCPNCLGITSGELFYGYFYKERMRKFLDEGIQLAG